MGFETLEKHYTTRRNAMVKRVSRAAGSKEAAEDIVQEAYTRALQFYDTFDQSGHFEKWFSRILSNCLNHYKNTERGHPSEEFDEEFVEGIEFGGYNTILLKQIQKDIKRLDGDEAEVLRLYFCHGYSPRNISKVVDFKYKTILQVLYRFKLDVRDRYGEGFCS